jgi:molecular chaperone GrpE
VTSRPTDSSHRQAPGQDDEPTVVIRDKRRIDPTSGEVRPEAAAPPAGGMPPSPSVAVPQEVVGLQDQLAERTLDLQRLKAEFDNYRRRVERDRALAGEQATGKVFAGLLGVLDDIGRARSHGDLTGPFRAIADQLEGTLNTLGLVSFGEPGDAFDPARHEALLHSYRDDLTVTTCVEVMRPGYEYAGRVLRAAQVAVGEPTEPSAPSGGAGSGDSAGTPADG